MGRSAGDPDPVETLAARWREDAKVLERNGHEEHAERLRIRAEEMEDAAARRADRCMTVSEAVEFSRGYSEKHLRKLFREGELRGEQPSGSGGRILFRVRDLPRKPTPPAAGERLERAASSS